MRRTFNIVADTVHLVLLVDDQKDMRQLARMLIELEQVAGTMQITEASGGADAISICKSQSVDVMVLDLHMPGVPGLEVLRAMRGLSNPPCVVAWSADDSALREAESLGAHAIVDKADADALVRAIDQCIARSA
jgi:CheY-like chemotaxis protein